MKTPLTDAQIKKTALYGDVVPADFARQLEEELNQSKLEAAQYRSFLYGCDKHKLWAGTPCIGCLEDERGKLKEKLDTLRDKYDKLEELVGELQEYKEMAKELFALR